MNWIHPDVPRRFRHVHRKWSHLTESERERYAKSLARCEAWGELAYFESWRDWYRSQWSPFAGGRAAW
ncbi:MAG: hypothetical protein D6692_12775 [Planctomycetota bacterium]|nr:MAG: hypothetical protein D6692_12775 [Planctomycetota bacterium]